MGGTNSTAEEEKLEECGEYITSIPYILHGSLVASICVLICLSFLTTRKFLWPDKCHGKPGVLVPSNMLDAYHHRWAFACAYGSITNVILLLFISSGFIYDTDSAVVTALAAIMGALEICVVFLPFFTCLNSESKLIAPIIGLVYTGSWFILVGLFTIECWNPLPNAVPLIGLAFVAPTLICLSFLAVKFILLVVKGYHEHQRHVAGDSTERVANEMQLGYVKDLLSPKRLEDCVQRRGEAWYYKVLYKLEYFVSRYIYTNKKYFMFSTRILCTLTLASICAYQLFILAYAIRAFSLYLITKNVGSDYQGIATSFGAVFQLVTWINFLFNVGQVIFILGKYRFDTLRLYRGDYSFVPKSYNPNNANILRRAWLFAGYQIAYMAWGFVIHFLVWGILAGLFFLLFILPFHSGTAGEMYTYYTLIFLIPLAIALTLRISQYCLAKFVFLQDKVKPEDADKPLALNNRRLWHVMDYFLFMFNIFVGIFSSLWRVLISMTLGLLFIARLDRSLLMADYERYDKGYMSYLCMLMLEHYHNNPVLRVFCDGLVRLHPLHQNPQQTVSNRYPHTISGSAPQQLMTTQWRRVRNRWQLAYTILKNPSLMQYRAHRLHKQLPDNAAILLVLAKQKMLAGLKERYQAVEVWNKKMEESGIIDRILERRAEDIMDELQKEMDIYDETHPEDFVANGINSGGVMNGIVNSVYVSDVEVLLDGDPRAQSYS